MIYFACGVVFGLTTLWNDFFPGAESAIIASASGAASVGAVVFYRAEKSTNFSLADLVLYLGILVPVVAAGAAMSLPKNAPPFVPLIGAYLTAVVLGLSISPRLTSKVLAHVDPSLSPLLARKQPGRIRQGVVALGLIFVALGLPLLSADSIRQGH